jgi:hypothetical protein
MHKYKGIHMLTWPILLARKAKKKDRKITPDEPHK